MDTGRPSPALLTNMVQMQLELAGVLSAADRRD
jgi:shikimate kinase